MNPWRKYRIPTLIGKYPGRKDLQCLLGKGRLCDLYCVLLQSTLFCIPGSCPRREIENYEKFMTVGCFYISYQFHRNISAVCNAFYLTFWILKNLQSRMLDVFASPPLSSTSLPLRRDNTKENLYLNWIYSKVKLDQIYLQFTAVKQGKTFNETF